MTQERLFDYELHEEPTGKSSMVAHDFEYDPKARRCFCTVCGKGMNESEYCTGRKDTDG